MKVPSLLRSMLGTAFPALVLLAFALAWFAYLLLAGRT